MERTRTMPISVMLHIGFLALMVVLCVLAALTAMRRPEGWLCRHRLLGVLGACSGLIGVAIMIGEKVEHGYPHFQSIHARIGLLGAILLICVPALGLAASRGVNALRSPHRVLGRVLILTGVAALATGTFRYLEIAKPTVEPAPEASQAAPAEPQPQ